MKQNETSPNQTFPKSNKDTRKQKRFSVQICQDPSHLSNYRDFQLNALSACEPHEYKGNANIIMRLSTNVLEE